MAIVVTKFTCDDGHLGAFDKNDKEKIIKKITQECEDTGEDWLEDYGVTIDGLKSSNDEEFNYMLESISMRGYFEIIR